MREIRRGGRLTVLGADLTAADGRLCAQATAAFVRPAPTPPLPPPPVAGPGPAGEPLAIRVPWRTPWFWDTVEARRQGGAYWIRMTRPLSEDAIPLARVAAIADWASGLVRPGGPAAPFVVAFPNADLTVHLAREAAGEWIGLEAVPHWYADGLGVTGTVLHDERGVLGRCAQTMVLSPLAGG